PRPNQPANGVVTSRCDGRVRPRFYLKCANAFHENAACTSPRLGALSLIMQVRNFARRPTFSFVSVLLLLSFAAASAHALTAGEIMRKTVAKADRATNGSPRQHYEYSKTSI